MTSLIGFNADRRHLALVSSGTRAAARQRPWAPPSGELFSPYSCRCWIIRLWCLLMSPPASG